MIETDRLIIRRYLEKDFKDFWEIFSNNNFTQAYGLEAFAKEYDAWDFFKGKLKKPYDYAVVLKPTMKVIGEFSVSDAMFHSNKEGRLKEISFLENEKYQRKGYMTECGLGMIKFLFEKENVLAVYSRAFATNNPSLKFSKKCGMKEISTHKEFVGRGVSEIVTCEITREEFQNNSIYDEVRYSIYDYEIDENSFVKDSIERRLKRKRQEDNKKLLSEVEELLKSGKKEEIFLDKNF